MSEEQTENVEIEMSEEALKTIESVMPPEPQEKEEIKTHVVDENGKVQCLLCHMILPNVEAFTIHLKDSHEQAQEIPQPEQLKKEDPNRNEKGQFVEGNNASEGNGGRPCGFCERHTEIMNKVVLYKEWCRGKVDGRIHMPYIQELVSEDYLDITYDQFEDWLKSETHKEQHSELTRTISKLMNRQQLHLLKLTLKNETFRGAKFQLSVNHKMIETEKQIHAGDENSPMEFIITEERKIPEDGE